MLAQQVAAADSLARWPKLLPQLVPRPKPPLSIAVRLRRPEIAHRMVQTAKIDKELRRYGITVIVAITLAVVVVAKLFF